MVILLSVIYSYYVLNFIDNSSTLHILHINCGLMFMLQMPTPLMFILMKFFAFLCLSTMSIGNTTQYWPLLYQKIISNFPRFSYSFMCLATHKSNV